MSKDILPDSRMKVSSRNKFMNGLWWVPIFCANCGKDGGWVPEENMTFAFYLCNKCHESHGAIAGTYAMPDEVFWKNVEEEMIDKYGRVLSHNEMGIELESNDSVFSKLLREFKKCL